MRIVEPLLGTRAEIKVRAESPDLASDVEQQIVDEVVRLEKIFSVFEPTSDLHDYRRSGATSVPELATVLDLAELWRQRSGGAFDPRVGSLFDLWEQAESDQVLPSPDALEQSIGSGPINNLNAIAKGWIAQRSLDSVLGDSVLEDSALGDPWAGVESAWLNLGGDITHRGVGHVPVGIENPHRPFDNVAPLARVEISNEALATSGRARRWWTIGRQRYGQVLDPRTGWPVDHVASASVVARDAATADVLATIALIQHVDDTVALVQDAAGECLIVKDDGSIVCSSARFVV